MTVHVPAHPNNVHILRAVTASVAARLPMSIDDVDDLRLAVDEAAARLLQVPGGAVLALEVHAGADGLEILVASDADADAAWWPGDDVKATLPWKILTALAQRVSFERSVARPSIRFFKQAMVHEVRA